MKKATRVVAAALGVFAGIGGPEHGIFEMLQGHTRPGGLMGLSIVSGFAHDAQAQAA